MEPMSHYLLTPAARTVGNWATEPEAGFTFDDYQPLLGVWRHRLFRGVVARLYVIPGESYALPLQDWEAVDDDAREVEASAT